MKITSIRIANFRCFGDLETHLNLDQPDAPFTSLVGENNAGKSTVIAAVVLALQHARDNTYFADTDSPWHSEEAVPRVSVEFELDDAELLTLIGQGWIQNHLVQFPDILSNVVPVFKSVYGNVITCKTDLDPAHGERMFLFFGPFRMDGQWLRRDFEERSHPEPTHLAKSVATDPDGARTLISESDSLLFNRNVQNWTAEYLEDKLLYLSDVRSRPSGLGSGRGAEVRRSLDGSGTADLLMNLKNGNRMERDRFITIQQEFSSFFNGLGVDVEGSQGEAPNVVFGYPNHPVDLDQQTLGTGVVEVLTILANVVGLSGHVIVVEEPELHLHRLTQVALGRRLRDLATENQLILLTHSPAFVDFSHPEGILRVWQTDQKARVTPAPVGYSPGSREAFVDAFRQPGAENILFSRLVLLAEGSTEREFLTSLAPRVGLDLEVRGVAVVDVGGQDAFDSFINIVRGLELPVLCLRDNFSGEVPSEFEDIYTVLDEDSIEDYWSNNGLGGRYQQANEAVGSLRENKPRIGRWMGLNVEPDEVPELIMSLLNKAVEQAAV